MLMPSFCCPLVFGPNAWMTRPFTGQRNDGIAAVTSLAFGGSGFCAAGVTTFTAVGGEPAATGADAIFCVAGATGLGCCATSCGAAGSAAGVGWACTTCFG